MRSNSRLLGLGLLILAAVLAATWWSIRPGRSARPAEVAVRAEPRGPALELTEAADPVRTARDGDATSSGSSASPAARARTGKLRVRVEDAATRAPLAGIELRVARERGGDRLLATGTTDERGEARFEDVEANTVIVEARRAPPHARAFGAVWLEGDETETVVLAMGAGRTVRGRVVDDLGTPLAGAIVAASDDQGSRFRAVDAVAEPDAAAVTTPADGTFELAHLAPSPRNVWIERGAMAPRTWWPQAVNVRFEDAQVYAQTTLGEAGAEAVEAVGDIVVPRARTWSGRVVDTRGAPIPAALVSARTDRYGSRDRSFPRRDAAEGTWPGLAGFRLRDRESQCDPLGAFELSCRPTGSNVSVWTPEGHSQSFPLPEVAPGGRFDGLELRVDDATLLVLELVDRAGNRIREPHPRARIGWRPGARLWNRDKLAIVLRGPGFETDAALVADPDGLFRVQLAGRVEEVSAVRLEFPGYAPVVTAIGALGPEPVRVVLEDLPALKLRVRSDDELSNDPTQRALVSLHACIEDPALRAEANGTTEGEGVCCGLGNQHVMPLSAEATEIELAVLVDRPFFVAVRDLNGTWTRTFGPWRPDGEVHEIVVPKLVPRIETAPAPSARVRARVTDAFTGEPLLAFVRFEHPSSDPGVGWRSGARFAVLHPNSKDAEDAPAGRWRVQVGVDGYRAPAPVEVELAAGSETDLGAFALEPAPVVELIVVGLERRSGVGVELVDANGRSIDRSEADSQGELRVRAVVPAHGSAIVRESSEAVGGSRSQTVAFEYDGGGRLELRVAPWRPVEVRCPVSSTMEQSCELELRIGAGRGERLEERAPDAHARRFTGWLTAGTYVLRSRSLLLGSTETRIDVPAGGEDVVRVELKPLR